MNKIVSVAQITEKCRWDAVTRGQHYMGSGVLLIPILLMNAQVMPMDLYLEVRTSFHFKRTGRQD